MQYKKETNNLALLIFQRILYKYLFLMTKEEKTTTLFIIQCKCYFLTNVDKINLVITSHHRPTWQEVWVQVGHLDILGSFCHSNLFIYIIDVNFTSQFFRLWICTGHLKHMYLSRVVLSEMMKLRWRAQVVKECRQCQHEQKTAENKLKKKKKKKVLFDSLAESHSQSCLSVSLCFRSFKSSP